THIRHYTIHRALEPTPSPYTTLFRSMHARFHGLLPEHHIIELPQNEESAAAFARCLERHAEELAGIIVEPLVQGAGGMRFHAALDRKSTRLNSSHVAISYAVFCLKTK